MSTRVLNVLHGESANYLYPFFIVTEKESPDQLRADMKRLAANGVKGICIEPNGNKNFAGPGWWEQMDAIMEEARLLGMRVWLQDEPSFPTGSANQSAVDHPELQKVYLEEQHIDAIGPQIGATFLIDQNLDVTSIMFYLKHIGAYGLPQPGKVNEQQGSDISQMAPKIICVSACRKTGKGSNVDGDFIDLTDHVHKGILKWDIPEGQWRIFIVYTLKYGTGRPNYLNIFDGEAVELLIDKLYKPHYERYANDFGISFAGFFSDEPEFGNLYSYANDNSIGRKLMPLPWSADLALALLRELGHDAYRLLPALWYESGYATAHIRYAYMDILTRLYEKNFTQQIGEWCRSHHCEYIGHVVEDMGNHARLGCGTGHYFRAMTGQDYSGIDLVLQQVRPGLDDCSMVWQGGETGGEFFHYGLAKLGSSAAHIDPNKKGRSICEIFAAYGLSLGIKNEKWLFDHMLVRGINTFIPAWNAKASLDVKASRYDTNPQFRYNNILAGYVNRICHLFNDGAHIAPVAVLYHAEAEWSGDFMEFEKPVRVLLQNQIDCDVLPCDIFDNVDWEQTSVGNVVFRVNKESYHALVVPYSRHLTSAVAEFVEASVHKGFPVIFVDGLPEGIVDMDHDSCPESIKEAISCCSVVSLEGLAEFLRKSDLFEITASGSPKGLRYFHYSREDEDIFMFFNEEPLKTIHTQIEIPVVKPVVQYDPFHNELHPIEAKSSGGSTSIVLDLHPYESSILVFTTNQYPVVHTALLDPKQLGSVITITSPWFLSLASTSQYPVFVEKGSLPKLTDLSGFGQYPDFSGTMRYVTTIRLDKPMDQALLSLGEVYQTAEVWVNDVSAGVKICPPYNFDISGLLVPGDNRITIDVVNTLAHEMKDTFSQFGAIEPSGLIGPVAIHY